MSVGLTTHTMDIQLTKAARKVVKNPHKTALAEFKSLLSKVGIEPSNKKSLIGYAEAWSL